MQNQTSTDSTAAAASNDRIEKLLNSAQHYAESDMRAKRQVLPTCLFLTKKGALLRHSASANDDADIRPLRPGKPATDNGAGSKAASFKPSSYGLHPSTEPTASAPGPKPLLVLVIGDDVRRSTDLMGIINAEPDLAATHSTLSQAISSLEKKNYVVIILEFTKRGAIHLLKSIRERWPDIPVVIHSPCDDLTFAMRGIWAGAKGHVKKENSQYEFPNVVREVIRRHMAPPETPRSTITLERVGLRLRQQTPVDPLSHSELEVYDYIRKGIGSRQIAEELNVSVKTVECYRAHIKEKLQLLTASEFQTNGFLWMSTLA